MLQASSRTSAASIGIIAILVAACGSGGSGTGGGALRLSPVPGTDNQSAPVGTAVALPPAVVVRDAAGNPAPGIAVTYFVSGGSGSITGATGTSGLDGIVTVGSWVLGTATGPNGLTATAAAIAPVTFSATALPGPPALQQAVSGDGQQALPGTAVPFAPTVRVEDAFGNAIGGQQVVFSVTQGGGSVTGANGATDSSGEFSLGSWTLGPSTGVNQLTATVAGLPDVTFSATAVPTLFVADLEFISPPSAAIQAAFDLASARWSQVITGDLLPYDPPFTISPGFCGVNHPSFNSTVDDVKIWIDVATIDGPGGVLGRAGPCVLRPPSSSRDGFIPALGIMQFDIDDLNNLAPAILNAVILHEMAHVFGFGTLWGPTWFDLLRNPSCPPDMSGNCSPDLPGADTHFIGANGLAAFDAVGGTGWMPPGGATSKVPVENTQGGAGTRDGHWRESTFATELMTGFVGATGNELSLVTVASLADLGYQVDNSAADPYTIANLNAARVDDGSRLLLKDLWRGPLYLERAGRLVQLR